MQIRQVDLENVKSYARVSVPFAPGINAICGRNGAGKSTLLEAIGFALFDYLQVTRSEFIRQGEKTAAVTVHVMGTDERLYHVVRKCGGSNQAYVYDPELDQKLADGKSDVLNWLHDFLGVDDTMDLTTLFRDAIGVPQGLFTAAFLETPGRRKDVFNPLLRVDEYERAWDALRSAKSRLEKQLQEYDRQIAGLEAEVRILHQREGEAAELAQKLRDEETHQIELERELAEVTDRKIAMETVKAHLEQLEQAVVRAKGEKQTLEARLTEAQTELERAEAAQAVVEETDEGHQAHLAAQAELEQLEAQREERDAVQAQRHEVEKRLAQTHTQLTELAKELETIAQAEEQMAALGPQVDEQERIEAALAKAHRAADRLMTAQQAQAEAQTRLAELSVRSDRMRADLVEREKVETALTAGKVDLEPIEARHAQIAQDLAAYQAELNSLTIRQKQAADRSRKTERDLIGERARLSDFEEHLARIQQALAERTQTEADSEAARIDLEESEARRTALTETTARHTAALEQAATQLQVLTATESGQCPVCEGPLTPGHRAVLLKRQEARRAELETALAGVKAEQKTVEKVRRVQEKSLRALEERLKTLQRPDEARALEAQIATQQQACADRESTAAQAQVEIVELQARQAVLTATLAEAQVQLTEFEATRAAQYRTNEELERRLRTLPRPADADDLAEQCTHQEAIVAQKSEAVAELEGAPEEVVRWEQALATLGDPRKAYQAADTIAGRRAGAMRRKAEAESHHTELEATLATHKETLIAYAKLDDRLAEERTALAHSEPAHQRYLEHIREAKTLTERQITAAALISEAATVKAHYMEQVARRDTMKLDYDDDAYTACTNRHTALGQDLAALAAQVREQHKRQTQLLAEITRLREIQATLETVHAEYAEHQQVLALLEYLRRVLRDAGPEITKALVQLVSLQAERLYTDIMQDCAARLCWTDDYDIQLNTEGLTRSFQQLSGGEQMAAALAVRLALLREISTIDVAFFDEPTANLDSDRRANLAAQILKVKGFAQLFVISHDDTFEQDTDHVVHIVKNNGVSRSGIESGEWTVD